MAVANRRHIYGHTISENAISNNASAKFHRADAPGGAEVIYCRDAQQAVWFLPGSGMGIVQPKGLAMLKEIVDAL